MIRFRNPGTQYTTQIQVFRELYKEYKDAESFSLDEMAQTITRCSLLNWRDMQTQLLDRLDKRTKMALLDKIPELR